MRHVSEKDTGRNVSRRDAEDAEKKSEETPPPPPFFFFF